MGVHHSLFAASLQEAFEASGKTIEGLVEELDEAGYTVPPHALTNWMGGNFLPRSEAAGEVVSALERILGISQSQLVKALVADLASGKAFVPGEVLRGLKPASAERVDGVIDRKFAQSDEETDWAAEVIRVRIEDHITVGANFRDIRHGVVTWARVPAAPNPQMNAPVVYEPTDTPASLRLIYGIEGATLAGQKVYEMSGGHVNVTSRLALPGNANPGDLHRVAFASDLVRTEQATRVSERVFAWRLDRYECRVTFEGEVPGNVEYVFVESLGDTEMKDPVRLPVEVNGSEASIVIESHKVGLGWMEWTLA